MWLVILCFYTILCFYFPIFPTFDHHYNNQNRKLSLYNNPDKKLSPSQLKVFPIEIDLFTLNTLSILASNLLPRERGWNERQRQCTKSAQKLHKNGHKEFLCCTDIYVCDNFAFLFHFFAIWLSVKFKDFFVIWTLFQFLNVFVLLYIDKLNAQNESATCLCALTCCTLMLDFFLEGLSNFFQSTKYMISR